MQHTRIDPFTLHLWVSTIALQFGVGISSRGFLRVYLIAEAIIGSAALGIARLASWQSYILAYRGHTFLSEAITLFAILSLMNLVRRGGLPTRRSAYPIQIIIVASFAFGIHAAYPALALLKSPTWRLLLSWDQAFQVALCVMIGLVPIYTVYLSATLPKSLILKIIGFGAYSAANAGALDHFITHKTFCHMADFVYVGTLLIWFVAGREDHKNDLADPALELEDSLTI